MSDFFSDTDRDILDVLVEHRVATTAQLSALLEVPERTIRYRLGLLRSKGYARAVRPPADKGSAPDHWCPTRRADSWAKGERAPKGGDRQAPSTTFVEHSGSITALYVALRLAGGLELVEWIREAAATEEFAWRGRARKIVPDAFVLVAERERDYRAFVEIDLGSMSMTRLSQKLSGYAAYYSAQAWRKTHPFAPVLLLATTSESRAEAAIRRFEQRWAQAQRHLGLPTYMEEAPVPEIGACAAARSPEEALREPVWLSSGANDGLHVTDLLRPAWDSWAQQETRRREKEKRREQWRAGLARDPERCRHEVQQSGSAPEFEALAESLGDNEHLALKLLLNRRQVMDATERAAFGFFAARLAFTRRGELTAARDPEPASDKERRLAQNLAAAYLDRQKRQLASLFLSCPESPSIRKAIAHLDDGRLLRRDEINRLAPLIASHRHCDSNHKARLRTYTTWRGQAVEKERRTRRALSRLMFDPIAKAEELDLKRFGFCKTCFQIAIPTDGDLRNPVLPECSFCQKRAQTSLLEALDAGLVRPDEGGFWAVCHPPVPAWVIEEVARPLAQSANPDEEW